MLAIWKKAIYAIIDTLSIMEKVDINIKIFDRMDKEIGEYAKKSGIDKDEWFHNAVLSHLARNRDLYDEQVGTIGWKQFIASKKGMIDKFDRAKEMDRAHKTSVFRGLVAESVFRTWLSQFLPKRFGVTAGYIISQHEPDSQKLPHFDVIVYDQLNSPIYWTEEIPGSDTIGQSKAIPIEYVHAVIEVKASLRAGAAKNAIKHLEELNSYLDGVDHPEAYPKRYLPEDFCSAIVFFEDYDGNRNKTFETIGSWLLPSRKIRSYIGGMILRPNNQHPGTIRFTYFPDIGERGHVPFDLPCGNGDSLSSFMEDLLAILTHTPKHRYCFPAWMFPSRSPPGEEK